MPSFTPLKNDPSRHNVGYDYQELKKLHQAAKDIFMFSRMMEDRAHSMRRLRAYWDEEMACITRIYTQLTKPFEDFFSTVMHAAGDIAVDRKSDPARKLKESDPRIAERNAQWPVDHSRKA